MSYSEIKSQLHGLPKTWYPALLKHVVEECIEQKVFRPGQIHVFVRKCEMPMECPNCGKTDMQLDVIRETKPECLRTFVHCNWCGHERLKGLVS